MFHSKRTFAILIILWVALFFSLFIVSLFMTPTEQVINTKFNYSDTTLSFIVFAERDNSTEVENVDADIVFEKDLSKLSEPMMVNDMDNIDISKEKTFTDTENLEETVSRIEKGIEESLYIVGNNYIDEKIKEKQVKEVNVRGLNFIYDPMLSEINKDNLAERFSVFAPYDDYNKVLKAMSQMALGEAGGCSPTEIAATVWSVLNRFDDGYSHSIFIVISAPGQYHGYSPNKGLREDVYNICEDVIARWVAEKEGQENVGRVLPSDYKWFYGDGKHNHFRNQYRTSEKWNWSLPTPYNDIEALNDKSEKNWL